MQRQKSILSFFKKPTPSTMSSGEDNPFSKQQNPRGSVKAQPELNPSVEASIETDTPPAKVPRQVLPSNFTASKDTQGTSLFSSIAHKFVKIDSSEKSQERKQFYAADRSKESQVLLKDGFAGFHYEKSNGVKSDATTGPQRSILNVENDDVTEPETPGMRPVVPRLKRVQEDAPKLEDKNVSSLLGVSKRLKLDQELAIPSKIQGESSDVISKFEWLNPSKIRDANGRRPDNPLYDKNTLFIPPDALKKMSASQKQYWTVKSQYMDVMLFFKVGKFYELYELDAEIGHKELDWKITLSGVGKCRQVGISESGIDDAVGKLVARGYKVGRIEQLETSDQAKARGGNSVIQRKLVQVITPATMSQTVCPDAVYLLALKEVSSSLNNGATIYGFAFADCSAQYFWVGSVHDDASCAALGALLMQVSPKEVIYESRGVSKESQKALRKYSLTGSTAIQLTPVVSATDFLDASAVRNLIQSKDYFGGSSYPWCTSENGAMHHDAALCALGGLIEHLSRLMLDDVLRHGDIMPYHVYKGCLKIDGQTLVNLEIFNNNADGGSSGTLLNYLDNCLTSSGKRLLRKWICHPLKDVEGINNRLNVVEGLMNHPEFMSITGQYLCKLPDLERMLGRVKASMQASAAILLPLFGKKILRQRVKLFRSLVKGLRAGMDLLMMLQTDSQIISSLGNIFKLPELDGASGLDKFLVQFEAAIDSEFPNYQNHDVTDAEAETLSILIELFVEKAKQWSEVIYALSCVDVLRSFAVTASMSCGTVCRPVIYPQSGTSTNCQGARGSVLKIKGLWHPFALGENGSLPVPNDIILGEDAEGYQPRTLLLTGPNMGGKSTILRATCLAVILAQLGCFVPGEKCILSLVDVIFTRLGATDRIMTGESTFFVECTETASVLQNATQDSLVILDELGRGTSTFDGYAIAYSVFRHLVDKINCRLLFATHYHALTKEFASHPHVKLQHMGCAFKSTSENEYRDLVFLYRLTCGPCPESYGLQVATMAGVPDSVVKSASQAAQRMKTLIGKRFRSSEQRSEFSTLHEEWLKNLLSISGMGESEREDDDVHDTLICLWHELRSSYQLYK